MFPFGVNTGGASPSPTAKCPNISVGANCVRPFGRYAFLRANTVRPYRGCAFFYKTERGFQRGKRVQNFASAKFKRLSPWRAFFWNFSLHEQRKVENHTIFSGWNTSSKRSAVKNPSSTHASLREMLSLYAFFAVFAAFS